MNSSIDKYDCDVDNAFRNTVWGKCDACGSRWVFGS